VPPAASSRAPLQDDEVRHEGEPVALVLAETLEAAEHAAKLVAPKIEPAEFVSHPDRDGAGAVLPRESGYTFGALDFVHGDPNSALADGEVREEAVYLQPSRHHNPMEPSATLADWRDGTLTLVDSVQHAYGVRTVLAAVSDLPLGRVRVRSPHTRGGFGCLVYVWLPQMLAAVAALVV